MTPTPLKLIPSEWPFSVCAGTSVACRRVFENGVIQIRNRSKESAKLTIAWRQDLDMDNEEEQMSFLLVSRGLLEFVADDCGQKVFLDWIIVEHISGGEIQISQPAPLPALN
jgi:hypothetical protein